MLRLGGRRVQPVDEQRMMQLVTPRRPGGAWARSKRSASPASRRAACLPRPARGGRGREGGRLVEPVRLGGGDGDPRRSRSSARRRAHPLRTTSAVSPTLRSARSCAGSSTRSGPRRARSASRRRRRSPRRTRKAGPVNELELLDWKRRIFELYAEVRAARDPAEAWRHWRAVRDELFRTHPQSPLTEGVAQALRRRRLLPVRRVDARARRDRACRGRGARHRRQRGRRARGSGASHVRASSSAAFRRCSSSTGSRPTAAACSFPSAT